MTTDVYVGGLPLSNAGALQVTGEPGTYPSSAVNVGGVAVDTALKQVYVVPAGSPVGAQRPTSFWRGIGVTNGGALYITDSTTGSFSNVGGFRVRSDGALLVAPSGTFSSAVAGIGTTTTGAVILEGEVPVFGVDFNDLGSGAVNTTASMGNVAATFTRATTATTVNSAGTIVSVASGVARSYYDPTSLTYLGYLAEGARTNLLLRSQEFDNASWAKTDTTVTADNAISPDGTQNADLLTVGVAGTEITAQAYTGTADTTQVFTMWLKRGNHDWVLLTVRESGSANINSGWFNLATGAVGTVANAGTATAAAVSIQAFPNGWYRCRLSGIPGNGATSYTAATESAAADGNSGAVANGQRLQWGAQVENNVSFASSYIPTTTAAVTRNADVLTYPTSPWLNANAGTILVQWQVPAKGGTMEILDISDGTANERIRMFVSGANCDFLVSDGGVTQCDITNAASAGVAYKLAGTYAVNDFAASLNGGTVGTDTSGTLPAVNIINVGSNTASANHLFGTIRRVAYFATRLSNAQLQQITA